MFKKLWVVLLMLLVVAVCDREEAKLKLEKCLDICQFEVEMCATSKPCLEAFTKCKDQPWSFGDCLARSNSLFANRIVKCYATRCDLRMN